MCIVINSCYRHDFGYRNFKNQNRFTEVRFSPFLLHHHFPPKPRHTPLPSTYPSHIPLLLLSNVTNTPQTNKSRIDSNFKKDMFAQCANERFNDACEATANLYYLAVKEFGKKRAAEILEARRVAEGAKV
jgi:hypothetical protein